MRQRIVRQLLTESLLLAGLGAGLGVAIAYALLAAIRLLLPPYAFAPEVAIRINLPVLALSVAVALGTGVAFGLWPALRLSRPRTIEREHPGGRRVTGGVPVRRTQDGLIAAQIALTLLLLAAAGSAIEGFARMLHVSLGYDPHNVMSVGVPIHENSYTTWGARAAYFEQLQAKVAETPGVMMAAISGNATPPRNGWRTKIEIRGTTPAASQMSAVNIVSPNYFATLRIPLLYGRLWDVTENRNGALLAVINRTLAQQYFPKGDAIGQSIRLPAIEDRPPAEISAPRMAESWLQIVGVVEDSINDGIRNPVIPAVYIPFTLHMSMGTQILVRSQTSPLALEHSIRVQLAAVNSQQQAYPAMVGLETWISDEPEWQQEHLVSWIFGGFAGFALLLGGVGLYSVVSYTVAQRNYEFGIRMALGAPRGHVLQIVFASTLTSVGTGILAGVALTFALNRIVSHWAQGSPTHPSTILESITILALVAAISCSIPALRAARVDPMKALRCE